MDNLHEIKDEELLNIKMALDDDEDESDKFKSSKKIPNSFHSF